MRKKGLFAVMALLIILSLCLIAGTAQAATTYKLTVQVQKTGGGMVSANEGALGVKVTATLNAGVTSTAIITAVNRNASCTFSGWTVVPTPSGTCNIADVTNPTTTVTVSDKATVQANFTLPAETLPGSPGSNLTVSWVGIGGATGSVGITEAGGGTTITKPNNTKVTVVATATAGSQFFAWSWNMGFAITSKASTKFTMCGAAETVIAYFVPGTPGTATDLKKFSYWQYETTWGREVTYRTYTKVAESGSNYTSMLTSDKPEVSCSNAGTSSLGFSVGPSRMILESGTLQNIFDKTLATYQGRDVLCDLWYWDAATAPFYYGGPGVAMPVYIGMPVTVYTDGFSGGPAISLTVNAAAGQKNVEVASVSGFVPGESVVISDSTPLSEPCVIAAVGASRLVVANVVPGALATVVVLAGGGYAAGDNVTLTQLGGPSEVCNIVAVTPMGPVDALTMWAVANPYFAAAYPSVTLNRLTMAVNLTNAYSTAAAAQVAIPGASGLPYSMGQTFNYVEHQGIYYKIPLQVTVVDKEMVRVPAGLFECWKVETKTMDMLGNFTVPYRTDWFSEAVHMSVRSEYYIYAQPMLSSAPTTPMPVRVQTECLKKYKLNPLGW